MTRADEPAPEFSSIVAIADIGRAGRAMHLSASEAAREKIAKRLKTPSVDRLEGDLHVSATRDDVTVSGRLVADLTRECVASLELTPEHVEETFELRLLRAAPDAEPEDGDWDAPEVLEGGDIDVGEILVQQLALAMDPFPRKPGAASLADSFGKVGIISPFAGLAEALKDEAGEKSDEK